MLTVIFIFICCVTISVTECAMDDNNTNGASQNWISPNPFANCNKNYTTVCGKKKKVNLINNS